MAVFRNARECRIREYMGKTVGVIVDRPIGHRHGDIVYTVNYGFIPGLIADDGEDQDVYILGVTEPVSVFSGCVIGAVRREDDCEDKLVVAPEGMRFHQGEIAQAVRFQEQYFRTSIDSVFRKSCGVIPYRGEGKAREYLILLQASGKWSFPKGHMEAGETERDTALRELREETGLNGRIHPGIKITTEYDIPPYTHKQLVLFPGEVTGELKLQSQEINQHLWVKAEKLKYYLHEDTIEACSAFLCAEEDNTHGNNL